MGRLVGNNIKKSFQGFLICLFLLYKPPYLEATPGLVTSDITPIVDLSSEIKEALVPLSKPPFSAFNEGREIILAFSPKRYHAFLVVGQYEFHGSLYPHPSFYRLVQNNAFRASFFIRFLNLSQDDLVRMIHYIKLLHGHKTATCLWGVAEVLARGAHLKFSANNLYSNRKFISKAIKNGFMTQEGHKLISEAYITNGMSFKQLLKDMDAKQAKLFWPGLFSVITSKVAFLFKRKGQRFGGQAWNQNDIFPSRNFHREWLEILKGY